MLPSSPQSLSLENTACVVATQNLRVAHDAESWKIANSRLRGTVDAANPKWADEYIAQAQLWDVAAWRHGCRLSKVPLLRGPEGLVHAHEDVADILS